MTENVRSHAGSHYRLKKFVLAIIIIASPAMMVQASLQPQGLKISTTFAAALLSSDPSQNVISTIAGTGGNGVFGNIGDNGPAVFANLAYPYGVGADSNSNVFIADSSGRIRKITRDGIITTIAGNGTNGFSGDGGPATAAQLNNPSAVVVDAAGNLFIADTSNHRIRKVTPDGVINTIAGNGTNGFSGDGGPGTSAQLYSPEGMSLDGGGNLFIADFGNNRVRKLTSSGVITTVAGNGIQGFAGDGGAATAAQLWGPWGVALSSTGSLLFTDSGNHRVRSVDNNGIITTIAGTGVIGFLGDGGPAASAQFSNPLGIAIDSADNVFISDWTAQRVREINAAGVIQTVAGTGNAGFNGDGGPANAAQLYEPHGLAVDSSGALLVVDSDNYRLRKIRIPPVGIPAISSIVPSTGVRGTTLTAKITGTNLAGATAVTFSGTGVAGTVSSVDPSGTSLTIGITIASDAPINVHTFSVITMSAQTEYFVGFGVYPPPDSRLINTFAGNGTSGFSGDGGPATSAQLYDPVAVAADAAGNVFVADLYNNRVRKVSPQGVITTVAGTGMQGFSGDGGSATSAALSHPNDIAVDNAGNLFIADGGNSRVRKVSTNGIITTIAGNGTCGSSGDGASALAASLCPYSLALDNSGNLYIGDPSFNRVRVVSVNGVISTAAGTGVQGFKGDGGPANMARLSNPGRLAVNAVGDLFIADVGNKRIRKVNSMGVISTVAGNGQLGSDTTEGSMATSVPINPGAIGFDLAGNLLIADGNRLRRVNSTGAIVTIAGGGTSLGDGLPPTFASFSASGIAVDPLGEILIADSTANRIRIISSPGAGTSAPMLTGISAPLGLLGTTVSGTLTGINLGGANAVIFSGTGVTATISGVGTDTSIPITIFISAGAEIGPRSVTVTTAVQVSNSLPGFTVSALSAPGLPVVGLNTDGSPTMSLVTASQGTMTAAMIFGANFTGATSVSFSGPGVTATILSGVTDTAIPVLIAVDPSATVGSYSFTVTAATGTSSPRSGFSVVSAVTGNILTTAAGAVFGTVSSPAGIAADAAGNIFFADSGHQRVSRINPFGVLDIILTQVLPSDVAVDNAGNLYVNDFGHYQILKRTPTGTINVVAGTGVEGFSGDNGPAINAQLLYPNSIAIDSAGNMYIGDSNRVRMVNSAGIITTIAGNGTSGFSGDGGPASAAQLESGLYVAVDASQNLFIADRGNHRIRKVDSTGVITTIAGTGVGGFSGDGGPALSAQLFFPSDVALDKTGNIFIADNGRIRMINSAGTISTIVGGGSLNFGDQPGSATSAQPPGTNSVVADLTGNLWFTDGNFRVHKVIKEPPPTPVMSSIFPSSGVQGTTVFATISGTNLSGAAAVMFSGTGITCSIVPGGTDTALPVAIKIDPTAPPGARNLTITTENSVSVPAGTFTVGVTSLPRITSITPNTGVQGTSVPATITGANLTGVTGVTFDGTGVTAAISGSGSDTSLPVTVTIAPNASAGLRRATVVTPAGSSAPVPLFTVSPSTPTISSVSVSSVIQGSVISATITGTNLSGVTSVAFSGPGMTTTISGVATATSLPITISASGTAPVGSRTLTVATADKISAPFNGFNVVANPVPIITGISPGLALTGTTIAATIVGAHLTGATSVTFTGTGVTANISGAGTDTSLPVSITTALGATAGTRAASVSTPNGTSDLFNGFTVQTGNPIRITSISPISITQGIQFSGTISGDNLTGATGVVFSGGGVTAVISGATSSTTVPITGTVAGNASTGNRTVTVITTSGNSDPYSGVRVVSAPPPSLITTVMGTGMTGYSGDGYNAAELNQPSGIAVDNAGNIFIADYANNRIRKLTPSLVISTVVGNGTAGFTGDGGPASSATLNHPAGVTIDSSGNLFIVDTLNNAIRKVNPAGVITKVAGNGFNGFSGDGGPATSAKLSNPNGIAIDPAGNLFIADSTNQVIREVTTDGIIHTIAGTNTAGFGGDGGAATSAQLNSPSAVAVDASGNILIADLDNNRIRKVTAGVITTIAGTGTRGFAGDGGPATSAQLFFPVDVKFDASGNILIADYGNNRIRRIDSTGAINTVVGAGTAAFFGDGGPATAALINGPFGIATDSGGDIFIADLYNARVRRVNSSGVITTFAGNGTQGFNGDGPASLFAQTGFSGGVAFDPSGNLFFADSDNNRVRKVTPAGMVSTVAGNGNTAFAGDGGPASSAALFHPSAVAVDGMGNVFIADNNRVRRVSANGIITTIAGTGVAGASGDGGPASIAQLSGPTGLAIDATGNLLIADTSNHRIRMVDVNGVITTLAGNGVSGFAGDGGPATAAELNTPYGITVDASGTIFIADSNNNRVRKVVSGVISTVAGSGAADFDGDDGPASAALLNQPTDVAVDSLGNLFISDSGNYRVRMVNPAGVITTVAGTGAFGYSGDGGPAGLAQLVPWRAAADGGGNIVTSGNYRIRKITFTSAANLPVITAISPFAGKQNSMVPATITGTSLTGASAVNFSGAGVSASINAGGTDTSLPITITVASGALDGLRTFNVVTAAGTSEAYSGFTVTDSILRPALTSISPLKGVIGNSVQAVISGTGLTGATAVTFSGTGVTAAIGNGGTDTVLPITITIASNASMDLRTFTVTASGGISAAFNGFTVVRPMITGIAPVFGTAGFTGNVVINGANLAGATAVSFSGTGVAGAIGAGATDLTVPLVVSISPGATPGVRDITVTAQGATSPPFTGFTVFALGPSGVITTFAGDGTTDFKGDAGPAIYAGLDGADHVAVDNAGNVYISDQNHFRVRKVTLDGVISTVAGSGSYFFSGDGGPATQAGIDNPEGIAVDGAGNLFILDSGNYRVRKVSPNGVITTVAGNGGAGFSGDGGPATSAAFNSSGGLAVDGSGNLFIADMFNNRIRKVTPNGVITTVAGNGTAGFSGDGGPATSASIYNPVAVAVDTSGNLFIADIGNQRIRKVTPAGTITTIAGNGATGYSGDGGPATSAALNTPAGMAFDRAGNLILADQSNHRIRKIDTSGTITTIVGNGTNGFGDGGPAIAASVGPSDVAVDSSGNLFIADFINKRIRKVTYTLPPAKKGRGQITSQ